MSSEGIAKIQALAQSTAAAIRTASFNLKQTIDHSGMTDYGQKLAANVVNTGVPTVTHQVHSFVALLWKKLIEFLDARGLKEPLERNYEQFKGLPVVQFVLKLFAELLKLLFKNQFVQKVIGRREEQVVQGEAGGEGTAVEEVKANGQKVDEPTYTVIEALQKAAIGGQQEGTTTDLTKSFQQGQSDVIFNEEGDETVRSPVVSEPAVISTVTDNKENKPIVQAMKISSSNKLGTDGAGPAPANGEREPEDTGNPGPPLDEEAAAGRKLKSTDSGTQPSESKSELVRGSSWRAP
eukprot:TRINITY_DN2014_c0_g1_i15.p2 TRINITY_DN2014_c0_g1~~TRINITY_DN2014_c0_g1_i15.p2  ORF type:complete len:306 (+),score=54.84 TRINITY_DN2014_c0_g1_i15:37-918(+)